MITKVVSGGRYTLTGRASAGKDGDLTLSVAKL